MNADQRTAGPSAGRVLIVDDEPIVRDVLERYLTRDGLRRRRPPDGVEAARAAFDASRPDLVLLDLMLPRLDGFEVFRRIRARAAAPVIMLTARGQETDRIVGLELGRRRLRREAVLAARGRRPGAGGAAAVAGAAGHATSARDALEFAGLRIDPARREVELDGAASRSRPKEFDLLHSSASNPRIAFSRVAAARAALGRCLRRRSVHSDRSRPPPSREDRARPLEPEPARHGLGRRLPVRAMSRPALPSPVAAVGLGPRLRPSRSVSALGAGGKRLRHLGSAACGRDRHGGGDRRRASRCWRVRSLRLRFVAIAAFAVLVGARQPRRADDADVVIEQTRPWSRCCSSTRPRRRSAPALAAARASAGRGRRVQRRPIGWLTAISIARAGQRRRRARAGRARRDVRRDGRTGSSGRSARERADEAQRRT